MVGVFIRKSTSCDYENISKVNDLAFNRKQEGELIVNLRKRPEFMADLSLVAEFENKIIGHILFFPIHILSESLKISTLSLAPMSVMPDYQNKGLGENLIKTGLIKAGELRFSSVVVLGHPKYYPKFGFKKASTWKIKAPFDAPDEAMMAIELKPGSLDFGGGVIDFPEEYYQAL
jgi:predicted N-acetyltransferase YhbS